MLISANAGRGKSLLVNFDTSPIQFEIVVKNAVISVGAQTISNCVCYEQQTWQSNISDQEGGDSQASEAFFESGVPGVN